MRTTLILLVLAGAPAFCQDVAVPGMDVAVPSPDGLNQKLNDNVRQRLNDILNPLQPKPSVVKAPQLLRFGQPRWMELTSAGPCSIPLLNAVAPGKPVPMPNAQNAPHVLKPMDRMSIAAPAPACRGNFREMPSPSGAPATAP